MSWQEALVVIAGIAGAVILVLGVLPYLRGRTEEQKREAALKAANERIDKLEGALMDRGRLPTQLRRGA